jgi:hypothetical protein
MAQYYLKSDGLVGLIIAEVTPNEVMGRVIEGETNLVPSHLKNPDQAVYFNQIVNHLDTIGWERIKIDIDCGDIPRKPGMHFAVFVPKNQANSA